MSLDYIYKKFQDLDNINQKIAYLQELSNMDLDYNINFDNLIKAWQSKK
jgi:hypothetical protein